MSLNNEVNINNCYIIIQSKKGDKLNYQCKNKKKTGNFCQTHINMYAKKGIDLLNSQANLSSINMIQFKKLKYKSEINTHIHSQSLKQIKDKIEQNNKPWYTK